MRLRLLALAAVATALGLVLACHNDGLSPGAPLDLGAGGADLATGGTADLIHGGAADLASGTTDGPLPCAELTECECRNRVGCLPAAQKCHCPFPQCGPGACLCSGGAYFGCIQRAVCEDLSCSAADNLVGPDVRGCYHCALASCQDGIRNLIRNCGFGPAYLGALGCDKKPDCIAACMRQLDSCNAVGCTFCTTCDCGGSWPFDQCVARCLK